MARKNTTKAPARTFAILATEIKEALVGLEGARGTAETKYKEVALMLDNIEASWTAIKFNVKEQAENAPAAVKEARTLILGAAKEAGVKSYMQVWQNIQRHSAHYTGSGARHPDVIEANKVKDAADKAVKGEKEKPETSNAEPVADTVAKNPQFTRVVLSHLIAGLSENRGLKKANKVSTAAIDALIEALEEASELCAALKS